MTLFYANGSASTQLSPDDLRAGLRAALEALGPREKVIAIPPDFSRFYSQAGPLTCMVRDYFGDRLVDVMPALGTHFAMKPEQLDEMFPGLPHSLIRVHRWRDDVVTVGEVPAEFVRQTTDGIWTEPWPAQMNRLVWEGGHDLILSIGQVVPHEVIGMANYNKNIFVGTGGVRGINESHYLSAVYGVERTLGRADNPLRRILNYAQAEFCGHLPLVYVLTVVTKDDDGTPVVRGLFIGDDDECFFKAAELSAKVNITAVDEPLEKVVAYMDPKEFPSTWLGNKAVYRTRMAIADGGELVIIGPGVETFGEDPEIDRMIRKYGYRSSVEVMRLVEEHEDLRQNLSAAAHLIHGTSDGRFRITWCPGGLTREEIESVGYEYGDVSEMLRRYEPQNRPEGWHKTARGEPFYFVPAPASGLWSTRERLEGLHATGNGGR